MKTTERKQSFLSTSQRKFLHISFMASIGLVILAFKIPLRHSTDLEHWFEMDDGESNLEYILAPLPPEKKVEKREIPKSLPTPIVQNPNIVTSEAPPELDNLDVPTFDEPLAPAPEVFVENIPVSPRDFAEKMPEYVGGEKAMFNYLGKNIDYCSSAKNNDIQGTVYVRFVIDTDGSIINAEIAKGVFSCLDKEALEAVKRMPKWIPAEHGNRKVPVVMVLPVNFKLKS
jgi:protein TonB